MVSLVRSIGRTQTKNSICNCTAKWSNRFHVFTGGYNIALRDQADDRCDAYNTIILAGPIMDVSVSVPIKRGTRLAEIAAADPEVGPKGLFACQMGCGPALSVDCKQ